MKRLSVCVLIYNSILYVERCINSLLQQTDREFEIVLINNASTDGSIKKATEMLNKGNFINYKIVNIEKNTGCGQGRTMGYLNASNEYVKNLDSDDTLPPYFVYEINRIISDDSPDIISYGHNVVDGDGKLIRAIKPYKNTLLIKYTLTMFWRYVFKKEIAQTANVNTIGMHYGEDRIFSLTMIPYIDTIRIIDRQMYNYYKISTSTTKTNNQDSFLESNTKIFLEYRKLYSSLSVMEKKYLKYAITKFYVSISAMNCKGDKCKIKKYFKIYKDLYLNSINQKRYRGIIIVPPKSFSKEAIVIQISYLLLRFKLLFMFKFIFKKLY